MWVVECRECEKLNQIKNAKNNFVSFSAPIYENVAEQQVKSEASARILKKEKKKRWNSTFKTFHFWISVKSIEKKNNTTKWELNLFALPKADFDVVLQVNLQKSSVCVGK